MPARVSRAWRAIRSSVAFVLFGIGGLLIAFVALPVGRLLGSTTRPSDAWVQRAIHRAYRIHTRCMEALGLIEVVRIGAEALSRPGPMLIVATHPTLIDVVLLVSMLPQADCIVNVARARNPFLAGAIRAAGYVRNDGGPAVVDACVERLAAGRTVVVFPEGTRSPAHGLGELHRGAAHIALRSGCPLLPVAISSDPPSLRKGQKWYDVPDRTVRFKIRVLPAISPAPYRCEGRSSGVAARRLTAALREAFEKGLASNRAAATQPAETR